MTHLPLAIATLAVLATTAYPQTPAGPEFLVNTTTAGSQVAPTIAITPDGFVVTWSSEVSGTDYDVFGQAFDRRGSKIGAEFRVNAFTTGRTWLSDVAPLPGGRFVVAWESAGVDGADSGIAARIFEGPGVPLTGEIVANTHTTGFQQTPSIASDVAGNFVVVWNSFGQDGDGGGVFGQRFDASGTRLGSEFQVNTTTAGTQLAGFGRAVAKDAAGRFVVVWDARHYPWHVNAQRFAADGARVGAEFQVDAGPFSATRPAIATSPTGDFVVAWSSLTDLYARRHAPDGTALGSQFEVTSSGIGPAGATVQVESDDHGNLAFSWSLGSSPGQRSFVRRFLADGASRGPETVIAIQAFGPTIESDSVGNLVAAWHKEFREDIGGRRFGGLHPRSASVDTSGNGVLEPGETVDVRPAWRNDNGAALTFAGVLSNMSGPAGATYAITDATGDYGTVADMATAACTDCYGVSVSAPPARPATHWDATITEPITPDALGQMKRWTLHVGDSFTDVPRNSPFYRFVETLLHHGVTGGCTATDYCPLAATSRAQMAVFVLVAKDGAAYSPPACGAPVFGDVPAASPFCRWIEELARRGVVSGCGAGLYCPDEPVTREQMAVFVLRTLEPASTPPACGAPVFADVPPSSPFCPWVEELARRGVVTGCGNGNYSPAAAVTREQMGVFISATFTLALYGP